MFADHPRADDLRPVVDALVYRERAMCPWELLPPEFPQADVLRPHLAAWEVDGTWEAIAEVASEADDADLSALGRLRRAGALTLRAVPGGVVLLGPGRLAIKAAEYVRDRFRPEARLPRWYRRAVDMMWKADYTAAVEYYTRILDVDPRISPSRVERASAYVMLGRYDEAVVDCRRALSSPDAEFRYTVLAHLYLGQAHALAGDLDRGARHWLHARVLQAFGPDAARDDDGGDDPDRLALRAAAHDELAEFLINTKGAFAAAVELYRRREQAAARYAGWLATVPPRTLYLNADWARNVGHIALVETWVKMQRLGWVDRDRVVFHAPRGAAANPAYVEYFKPLVEVKEVARPGGVFEQLSTTLGPRVAGAITLPDGTSEYFCNALGVVQEAWEAAGHGPLLSLTPDDRAFGRGVLREMGVPDGAWFVALHVRSPGFYREEGNDHQAHRNADIETYLPAVREIVRRGGWVVRLGDKTMPPLPPTPGAVDYARSEFKSPRMDVFLCGAARFLIGVTSGVTHIPYTFGVPVLTANWMSNVPLGIYNAPDLCLPKLLWSERAGRLLGFRERYSEPVAGWCHSNPELRARGLRAVDNTPGEIHAAVAEMLDRLDGTYRETPEDARLHARYADLLRSIGVRGAARTATTFLRAHADLLDAAPVRAAA